MLMKLLKSRTKTSHPAYNEFLAEGVALSSWIESSPHRPHDFHLPARNVDEKLIND